MKRLITIIASVLVCSAAVAQQTSLSNFYNFNEYLLNPAEAGANNFIEGTASHRIQWQGIEGAPTTTFFGMHGAVNEKMGIGAKITVDQTDILKQFNAALSYAYRIKLNEKANLSFGVSGMMVQNSVGYGDAVVGNLADEVVNGGSESGIAFDAEAGVMLQYHKFRFGVASAHLFESGVGYDLPGNGGEGTFERVRQFSAYTSYEFDLSDNWKVEPFVLVRNQGVESLQFEVNALTTWKEILHLGAGYRQEAGFIGRVGFQITDQIVAAYAYEMGTTGVASYSNGSHEFMLGYRLASRAKKAKDVKKELAPEPIAKKVEELKLKPIVVQPTKEVVQLKDVVEHVKEEVVTPVPPKPSVGEKKEVMKTPVFEKDIKFEFETSEKENSTINKNESLDEIAAYLVKNRSKRALIKGHTCDMGNDEVNTFYSNQRANTVKQYLLSKGVNEKQMEIKAMLDREPLVPNISIANRQKNRRVEVELIQ
jgi:type IX secretion system PorP/SprF family membrane protein